MRYHIITVGSELTLGLSVNTNAAFIAKRLGEEGYSCTLQVSVPDNIGLISNTIKCSLSEVDLLIITGGLGPTSDDITREAICEATGRELIYKPELAQLIQERFGARANGLPELVFKQAYLPESAVAITPTIGSAPGILLKDKGKLIASLPGVPREMKVMLDEAVIPWFKQYSTAEGYYKTRVLRTTVKSEGTLQEAINDIIDSLPDVTVGIIASPGEIQLQLVARADELKAAESALKEAETRFVERLGRQIFGFDDESMELVVGNLLKKHGQTLALAESCTGGLVSKRITDIPGSSEYFLGGIISYSNSLKTALLAVPEDILAEHGAVSQETALAMAQGIRAKTNASFGLSITGIAGPEGGTAEKPVGLVYIGLADKSSEQAHRYVFFGSREIVRRKSCMAALDILRNHILESFSEMEGA